VLGKREKWVDLQLRIDFHVHTKASSDGVSSIDEIVRSARNKHLDGFAVTDHNLRMEMEKAFNLSSETGLLVIPGVEVTTSSGHLIVLAPQRDFSAGVPFLEAVSTALSEGSIVLIPHPTDPLSHGVGVSVVESSLPYDLPLEVMNASTLHKYNISALELADRLQLAKLGGSDAHWAPAVGDAFTLVEARKCSMEAVFDAVKSGQTKSQGRETQFTTTVQSVIRKLIKRVKL